jgi:hypothetical protein
MDAKCVVTLLLAAPVVMGMDLMGMEDALVVLEHVLNAL